MTRLLILSKEAMTRPALGEQLLAAPIGVASKTSPVDFEDNLPPEFPGRGALFSRINMSKN